MIQVSKAPAEGAVIDVKTSNLPELNSRVEFIKGNRAVALGIVIETPTPFTYKVLVVASEAGGIQ